MNEIAAMPADRDAHRPRVLVVEPRRNYLGAIGRRLSQCGYRIVLADSMGSAIAALHRGPIDLILCEFRASTFQGRELAAMVRGDVTLRDIPLLMIAGRSERRHAIAAFEAGADGVITKPFHFEVLCARIQRELERKRAIAELRDDNRTLDARVTERAIAIGEIRDRLAASEAECARLQALIGERSS